MQYPTDSIYYFCYNSYGVLAGTERKGKEIFYLTTHSTHFYFTVIWRQAYGKGPHIVREETRCRQMGYSFRLTARLLLYAPSHRQDSTYNGLCYTRRGALAGTRNSSMGPLHEGSIRRPIAPWANALTTELRLAPAGTGKNPHTTTKTINRDTNIFTILYD